MTVFVIKTKWRNSFFEMYILTAGKSNADKKNIINGQLTVNMVKAVYILYH